MFLNTSIYIEILMRDHEPGFKDQETNMVRAQEVYEVEIRQEFWKEIKAWTEKDFLRNKLLFALDG